MSILKGNQSDDLTLKYLLEKNRGGGGSGGVPEPATEPPEMDGAADVGSSEKYAREDHVHPTDTTRASQSSVNGKVSKSGDTMTGDLTVDEHKINVNTTIPSSAPTDATKYKDIIVGYDENDARTGYINLVHRTDGKKGLQLEVVRNVSGSNVYNTIRLTVDESGNKAVSIDAAAWRTALGFPSCISDLFLISTYTKDNVTVTGDSAVTVISGADVSKSGYKALGLIGFNGANASSSGANISRVHFYNQYMSTSEKLYVGARADPGISAKIKVVAYILYVKSS